MSCTPKCTQKGCTLDHGPLCKQGQVCENKNTTCSLYHPPRERQSKAKGIETVPSSQPTKSTAPSPSQQITPPYIAQTLNAGAAPFVPPPPKTSFQSPTNLNNLNANASIFTPPQAHGDDQYFDEDEDYDCSDAESYDDDDDDDDKFATIVANVQHKYPNLNDQEVEALANELFYEEQERHKQQQQQQRQQQQQHQQPQQQRQSYSAPSNVACQCCYDQPLNCDSSALCLTRGTCICVDDELDNAKLDTWFPPSASCPCCKGFRYRCLKKTPTCASECDCTTARLPPQ